MYTYFPPTAFLVGQGIMSEAEAENYTPDGTECPVRRVASAPTTPLKSGGPIAPSPSHSPVTRAAKPLSTVCERLVGSI